MSDNTSATGCEAGSPLSGLVETPGNVRGDRGCWLRHFQSKDHATTPLIISPNTSASDLSSSFELIFTLIISNFLDKYLIYEALVTTSQPVHTRGWLRH